MKAKEAVLRKENSFVAFFRKKHTRVLPVLTQVAIAATLDGEIVSYCDSKIISVKINLVTRFWLSNQIFKTMPILNTNNILFGFLSANTFALLFLAIYIVITLSDLDCDYLNPTQCSAKLNKV